MPANTALKGDNDLKENTSGSRSLNNGLNNSSDNRSHNNTLLTERLPRLFLLFVLPAVISMVISGTQSMIDGIFSRPLCRGQCHGKRQYCRALHADYHRLHHGYLHRNLQLSGTDAGRKHEPAGRPRTSSGRLSCPLRHAL